MPIAMLASDRTEALLRSVSSPGAVGGRAPASRSKLTWAGADWTMGESEKSRISVADGTGGSAIV